MERQHLVGGDRDDLAPVVDLHLVAGRAKQITTLGRNPGGWHPHDGAVLTAQQPVGVVVQGQVGDGAVDQLVGGGGRRVVVQRGHRGHGGDEDAVCVTY